MRRAWSPPTATLSTATVSSLASEPSSGVRYVRGRSADGDGGEGWFAWRSGDQSANVTDDPDEGIHVAPANDPTGASGAWVRVFSGPVHVAWWGCSPGATAAANTTAINAAIAYLATGLSSSLVEHTLVFPEGRIEVTSIDLTEWFAYNLKLYLHGTVLVGATADKAVVDATGSRYVEFHGGVITNKAGIVPRDGLQLGPKGTETCGNVKMWGLRIDGQFTRAAYTNLGSETTADFACMFINRYDNASAYAAIFDGVSTYLPISDYATVTRVAGTGVSFTVVNHYSSHFRRDDVTTGSSVYLAGAGDHTFDRGCYFLAYGTGAAYIVFYATSSYRNTQVAIAGSFEGTPSYGLEFTGDGTNTAIDNLKIDTHVPRCQTAWIHKTGLGTLRLSCVRWEIHALYEAAADFFNSTSLVSVDGELTTREAAKLNLGGLASFTGTFRVNDYSALGSAPAAGTWYAFDTANTDVIFGGDTPRIGTHSAIGSETVTGYITIRDSAGNARKVAVVS